MAFCTVDDLAQFLQITIAEDDAAALRAIAEAGAVIQNYCGQTLEAVASDEVTFDVPPRCQVLFLPELPVTAVAAVEEDGTLLTADEDYQLGNYGALWRLNYFWTPGIQKVTVTYSHGYATLPTDLVATATRMAARAYQAGLRAAASAGVAGVQGVSLGDYSVQYGSEQSGGVSGGGMLGASSASMLLPSERRVLDRYRLRRP